MIWEIYLTYDSEGIMDGNYMTSPDTEAYDSITKVNSDFIKEEQGHKELHTTFEAASFAEAIRMKNNILYGE